MRLAARLLLTVCAFAAAAGSVQAQSVATSPRPDRVAVSIYRDPHRGAERAMNLEWLNGFALVTETRTIEIPAGEAEIRFEGVAGGIIPQSAIVTGLPEGVREKNQDAFLLSPGSLADRSLGRRVHLRRTSPATGQVREHEAVIRSGAGGALVLQTEDGFEALRCAGLPETVVYDGVPQGLSARPTLSVRTVSSRAARATVTLSYLATGFDWQANYVATLSPDGDRAQLFAWVTLANGDETSFVDAQTQAIAGRLNYRTGRTPPPQREALSLRCWPQGTTSDIPLEQEEIVVTGLRVTAFAVSALPAPPPPPPPPPSLAPAMEAQQEDVGDLKLYRIPEAVTVSANSQKQVAFLQRPNVEVELVYRLGGLPDRDTFMAPQRLLVTRNRPEEGLGVPLPAGRLVLFGSGAARPILLGEGSLPDRAVGEEVEVPLGRATGVLVRMTVAENSDTILTATNDRSVPVRLEVQLPWQDAAATSPLDRRNGRQLWNVTVPANGSASVQIAPAGRP